MEQSVHPWSGHTVLSPVALIRRGRTFPTQFTEQKDCGIGEYIFIGYPNDFPFRWVKKSNQSRPIIAALTKQGNILVAPKFHIRRNGDYSQAVGTKHAVKFADSFNIVL